MKLRGFISAELTQYLLFMTLLLALIVPPLARFASRQVSVWHIEQHIAHLFELSHAHYANSVMLTRCLPQTDLDMVAIGETSEREGINYEVAYQQSGVSKAPPSGIEVSLTLTEPTLEPIKGWLHPDDISGNTLRFYAPLSYSLPDWQELDLATGCIP